MASANVTWHESAVDRAERWQALGQRGATIWFTGLPASGKSTIAAAVEARLVREGRSAYRLDGDNLRHGVCGDLGFSHDDRDENVRRCGEVARLFADAGTVAIVSVVSPFEAGRRAARALHERDGLRFVEVFVNTPVEECMRRDPKGLYARAAAGELKGMTGVDAPYEKPVAPDVELTGSSEVADAVELVLRALDPTRAARGTRREPQTSHASAP
ncbi:adenylyl-sulfate kinase [Conexibacter woesei]|uniref:Adenylyl-sulfate kinase n=1 Tax=Conexibacter woesei (strain DSM 14684 / CCUG 47730 / CIP 108061 / JCM 11494 / NBRC 100937 / ID131577) TaxID=469383 RepID=D3F1W7_CONWI|nr:adenylyl-sulfate kinase [Conexibacter woesei]ADB54148.1 adenylylsulfate kinase [Conexibacter woesei DSM 14684]